MSNDNNGTQDNEWSVYEVSPTTDAPEEEVPIAPVIPIRPDKD